MSDGIFIGLGAPDKVGGIPQTLNLRRANRHGLIAGAAGTGKTVTLQGIAESFPALGAPVFHPAVKGDLSGISRASSPTAKKPDKPLPTPQDTGPDHYQHDRTRAPYRDVSGRPASPP